MAGSARSPRTYLLLVGARANAGDHLIVARSLALLRAVRPEVELVVMDRHEPLGPALDTHSPDAVLLAGGPGLRKDLYPTVYPLLPDLKDIHPPIIAFGMGWKSQPGDYRSLRSQGFDPSSRLLLGRLASQPFPVGCRDQPTLELLARHGVHNAVLTGDPAWYDLAALGKPCPAAAPVRRIALSTPASVAFLDQLVSLAQLLQRAFPEARVEAVFHHGWQAGPHVAPAAAEGFGRMREGMAELGIASRDIAGDLTAMERTYADCDLHVGYRLHAHLLRLSQGRPSVLLHEDGRGMGASTTLGGLGIDAIERVPLLGLWDRTMHMRPWADRALPLGLRLRRAAAREAADLAASQDEEGWPEVLAVRTKIDHRFQVGMRPFLEQLP